MPVEDPRVGALKPLQPEKPPITAPPLAHFRPPRIGEPIHFFPHRGHHTEWYFGPYAAIVIAMHPNDPRICHVYWWGPKGETGSYADIPHRSMQPGLYPISNWLGHQLPPASHWAYPEESLPVKSISGEAK